MNIPQNPNGQATGANSTPTVLASDTGLPTGSNTIGNINLSTAITTGVTVLQNAAVATGNGTSLVVTGYGTAVLKITGSFSATINFEFSTDAGATWDPISATQIGAGDIFQSTTIPGSFRITCTALDLIRTRVTWVSGTSITINGKASNAINATKVVKLASGTNTYGKAFITDGTNSVGITSANIGGNETVLDRLKVNASLRMIDTAQAVGSQLVGATGTQAAGLNVNIKNTTVPVSGTFFQVTQPVSLATNTPDVVDRAARLLGVLSTGANTIGAVNIAAAQTLANVTTVAAVTAITNALPVGANTIGAVTNANLDVALSTRLKPADTLAAVTLISDTRQTTAANLNATVVQQVITKGTQGTNGITTQDLKDAGRNQVHYYTLIPVLTSATDTLQSMTGTKAGATVIATTTPAVITTGKTFRVTRLAATYIATAVSGYGIVRLRFQLAGVVTITSPIAATLLVGAGAPTTANSTASEEATLDEGWEFAAATGVGISVQGFAGVTATAVGYVLVSITGYEY